MDKSGKWVARTLTCAILGVGFVSLPITAAAWDFGKAELAQAQRIRQQETINREFQKLLVRAKAQQDQIENWHKTASARSAASTLRISVTRKDGTPAKVRASTVALR